jgi:hypothetical protein
LASAVEDELWPDNSPAFALECLKQSRQFLLASPEFLAIAYGDFPSAKLRTDATAKGFKRISYKGVDVWVAPSPTAMSIAPLNSQILLIADRRTLEAAIDRMPTEKTASEGGRQYSPLLARAAGFAEQDLWVVSSALPDPLASRFVPFDADASSFAGGVSMSRGMHLEATLETSSAQAAAQLAVRLRKDINSLPSVASGIQISTDAQTVTFALDVTGEQLQSSLRPQLGAAREPEPAAKPVAAPAPPVAMVAVNGIAVPVDPVPAAAVRAVAVPSIAPVLAKPATPPLELREAPKPPPRQVIRIFGLDDGVREIELPPVPGSR